MSEVQEGTELVPRLWLADGEPLNFFDRGFVPSASTTTLAGWLPDAQLFEQIDHLRCLVLLGEPNLGKTTALRQTYEAARDAGDPTLWVDLSSSTEESRLHDKIFGSSAWQGWIDGDWRLQVFLDTLDLALLRVETVTELIMDGLKGSPVDRLALRIACRSAERYREFEQSLRQAFGEEQFGVYQLLPFSFADVERIARDRLKDVGEFMASIVEKGIQAQAMVPGTLMMLLNVVSEEGVLPSSRVEIFREAAKLLCREPREQRRRGRAAPQLTAGQRLAITERIAGQTVLSAHAAVAMDTARATVDALDPNEFAGGHETDKLIGSPTSFAVTERAVSEVLRLGLFVGLDEGRLGFRHKTYAEFLCAAWLASGALGEAQIDDLLFTSVDSARRVVPQLREVAGWLSAMSSQFTERLLATDPVVLLSGDPMSRASN